MPIFLMYTTFCITICSSRKCSYLSLQILQVRQYPILLYDFFFAYASEDMRLTQQITTFFTLNDQFNHWRFYAFETVIELQEFVFKLKKFHYLV